MSPAKLCQISVVCCFAWLAHAIVAPVNAQFRPPGDSGGGIGIIGQFDPTIGANPGKVSARFVAGTSEHPPVAMVTVRLDRGWHIYSLTQPRGERGSGPQRTTIRLAPSPKYRLLAPFRSHPVPKTHIEEELAAWRGLEIQEHEGEVTFFAPLELAAGVDPASLSIRGIIDMLVCETSGQCVPNESKFTARTTESAGGLPLRETASEWPSGLVPLRDPTFAGGIQLPDSVVRWSGRLEQATVRPGETAWLTLAAAAPGGWHVYALSERDDKLGSKPTLIAFETTWGLPAGLPTTDAPVKIDDSVPKFGTMRYHEGRVTWTVEIRVPQEAEPGEYPIAGVFGYMACKDLEGGVCEMPKGARFRTMLHVVGSETQTPAASDVKFAQATYPEAATIAAAWAAMRADLPENMTNGPAGRTNDEIPSSTADSREPTAGGPPYDLSQVRVADPPHSLGYYVAMAFAGGLILNLMPCVLPVIGLKVMSFVEQAGRSRGHALLLNVWYSAGIIAVFLLLGVLAAWIGLSWGGQFGSTTFNVIIASVVFAMALSLLGVWEVPIPGFFGSGAVQEAAAKEGPLGAFLKGVVTTVLATPCTAPFMATAVAWAAGQSASTTLIVFGALGLGMSSPYLLVGVFPELLRFLPRPGAWMLTFKQLTGFVLLGTVVFILSFIGPAAVVPTVLLLVGIGMACWLFARTPPTADSREKRQGWSLAAAVLLLFAVASFGWLYPEVMYPRYGNLRSSAKEGWDPFSLVSLQKVAVENGRTVLVDFSASWCVNCHVLEQAVLETETVRQAIERAEAVTMYADWSDYPPEITNTIRALKSSGVPVIAIFPGSRPYEPIVFRGGYSRAQLIEALEQASQRRDDVASMNP